MKSRKIVLIGMMGSGKTTIARILSEKLNFKLFDCDNYFEKKHDISIKDYFKKFGESAFRNEENLILGEILKNDNIIVSTGGGVILKQENRNLLFNSDITTIFIDTDANEIYERIKKDGSRPLLLVSNPLNEIKRILDERKKYYVMADYRIENSDKTPERTADEIILKAEL